MLIERFKMILECGTFLVQREENSAGVYYEVRNLDGTIPQAISESNLNSLAYLQWVAAELYLCKKTGLASYPFGEASLSKL